MNKCVVNDDNLLRDGLNGGDSDGGDDESADDSGDSGFSGDVQDCSSLTQQGRKKCDKRSDGMFAWDFTNSLCVDNPLFAGEAKLTKKQQMKLRRRKKRIKQMKKSQLSG